jgi:hypothetical protein
MGEMPLRPRQQEPSIADWVSLKGQSILEDCWEYSTLRWEYSTLIKNEVFGWKIKKWVREPRGETDLRYPFL